ncbi:Zinc finger CCHC domain-containing protein 3 [Acipenser ruthenus]|uniref:Zinc finger CCHC domain-containing protein 3 n=1 Tax=Acipenser ruthenus TaxID=7906 RepID=A0A444V009_ACIRT|nr:Zinc finger CCHC domain-containing protein 3 [Acipenser ruthenus]
MNEPYPVLDTEGFWTAEWKFWVRLRKEGGEEYMLQHIPNAFMNGPDRGHCFYPGHLKQCRKCGSLDHLSSNCEVLKCGRCEETGHLSKDCNNEVTCNLCGRAGHVFSECAEAAKNKDPEGDGVEETLNAVEIIGEPQIMKTLRTRYGQTGPRVTSINQPAKEQRKPKERRKTKNTEQGEIVGGLAVADKAGKGADKAEDPVVAYKEEETIAAEPPVERNAPVEMVLPASETAAEQPSMSKEIQGAKSAKGRQQGIRSEVTALISGFETTNRFSPISEP